MIRNNIDLRNNDEPTGGTSTPNTSDSPATSQGNNDGQGRMYSEAEHQAELNRVMGGVRSQAEQRYEKSLLERFGVDSVDALETTIKAKKEADAAAETALQQMQSRLEALEKERNEAKAQAEKLELERKANEQREAFKKAATGARDADDLFAVVTSQFASQYTESFNEDGTVNKEKMDALVGTLRKQKSHLFGVDTPGIPSNRNNGQPPELNKEQREAARKAMLRRNRNNV